MDLKLKDKAVLVLASSKGLGKAIAQKYAEEGARVMVTSRDERQLRIIAAEIMEETGGSVSYFPCDITKEEDIRALVSETVSVMGTIDILINNAGGPPSGGFDQTTDEQWQYAFELNLLSYVRMIREVLPYMRTQKQGRIINVTSSSIKQPIEHLILSNSFRMGVAGLSKSLSKELAEDAILINTVGPGRISTERTEQLDQIKATNLNRSYEEIKEQSVQAIPLGRYGLPEEFANTVVFLGSFANTYITGQMLLVDGGMTKAY